MFINSVRINFSFKIKLQILELSKIKKYKYILIEQKAIIEEEKILTKTLNFQKS